MENERLRGEQVWLRAFEDRDLAAYKRATNSATVGLWAGFPWPHSDATVERWFEHVCAHHGVDEYFFTVCRLGGDDFIGTVWLWNPDTRLAGLELSVFLTEEAGLGQGLGSDAVATALDFIFGSYEVERVWLTTEAANARAMRAFEKAGFRHDGDIRHHFRRGGVWRDSALLAILREDWEALERARSWDRATVRARDEAR